MAAEILETGKDLKTIYVTHAHPDHYFGLGVIAEVFPKANVLLSRRSPTLVNKQFFGKLEHWEKISDPPTSALNRLKLSPMKTITFELEGQRLEIIPEVMGDMRYNTDGLDSFDQDPLWQRRPV